jgi:hypothetical protein
MTRSEMLRGRLDLLKPALSTAGRNILSHPSPVRFYPQYITAMHGISRAAVPLMKDAVLEVERGYRDAPWAQMYVEYLEHHIPEETGHDVWALEDLEAIGIDREDVLSRTPMSTIAAMVGAQYYWIKHVNPITLAGYLSVMEANPPTSAAVDNLRTATGFPAAAFRSMSIHARLDVRHEVEVYELIDALPLDDRSQHLLIMSALHTTELLTQALSELAARDLSDFGRLDAAGV